MVTELLDDSDYILKHLTPNELEILKNQKQNILKSIQVTDFHITY
jgi:hypothetical protein